MDKRQDSFRSGSAVVVGAARTPIGKFSGQLSSLSAVDLGGHAIAAAIKQAELDPALVDYVFMGHVLGAGTGQITARQAAAKASIPLTVPATTVDKVCLSSFEAIHLAEMMIRCGEAEVVVCGGMESMSQAPHLLQGSRRGIRYGDGLLVDSMINDGLLCAFDDCSMGVATEAYGVSYRQANAGLDFDRAHLDELALASHSRAERAQSNGWLDEEIAEVELAASKSGPQTVTSDEGVRVGLTAADLGRLAPAFDDEGIITAGNASQISDGACALILMSEERASQLGCASMGKVLSVGQVAGPDPSLLAQPSNAIKAALSLAGLDLSEVSLFEINEAFASVALASAHELGLSWDMVNVNGGAIALGHPLGATGARLVTTLLFELARRGGGVGVAAACGGGGQGDAIVVEA